MHPIVLLLIAGAGAYLLWDNMEEGEPEVQGLKNKDGNTIVVPTHGHHKHPKESLTDVPPPSVNGPQAVHVPPPHVAGPRLNPQAPALVTPSGATNFVMQSVEDLQRAANALGYGPLQVTGYVDARTRAALTGLQKMLGMPVGDLLGLPMRRAVQDALAHRAVGGPPSAPMPAEHPAVQNATAHSVAAMTKSASQLPVSDVLGLQRALNALGTTPPLKVDGIIGKKTTAAIKAFQISQGLVADGIAGPKTQTALQAAVDPKSMNTLISA
jgi:peptidoglycan hydrolase-like protein with peptidoglycan-binding domain